MRRESVNARGTVVRPFGGRILLAVAIAATTFVVTPSSAEAQSLGRNRFRSGSLVRGAFRPIVETASAATVRVKRNGKDAALGLIVGQDGYVLTKASELEGAITCHTADGLDFDAEIFGIHQPTDLALLKIDAANLPTIDWAEGRDPAVGRWVVSTGPDEDPVAVGIVSVDRRRIAKTRGILGVQIEEDEPGPRVTQIFPNSGAEKASLVAGDRISKVNGKRTATRRGLVETLSKFGPGETVELRVHRDDEESNIRVTLGHPLPNILNRGAMQNRMGSDLSTRRAGFAAVLQHDSHLDPVDCGGPLLDLDGRVVGINIARAGRTESFTLPTSEVRKVLPELLSGKLAPPKPVESDPVETKATDDDEPARKAA